MDQPKTGAIEARRMFITVNQFAMMANLSRRQLYRLRQKRPDGFRQAIDRVHDFLSLFLDHE
jgi:hypothetical protein